MKCVIIITVGDVFLEKRADFSLGFMQSLGSLLSMLTEQRDPTKCKLIEIVTKSFFLTEVPVV